MRSRPYDGMNVMSSRHLVGVLLCYTAANRPLSIEASPVKNQKEKRAMKGRAGRRTCASRAFGIEPCYAALLVAGALFLPNATQAAEPIRVGLSMALTGSVAPIGKQVLTALQIWRDDVNAKGGLLGRPVELVFYDDQSNPTNIPQLYTKLIDVDKVDLLIGPYATNMVAPAIPVLMQFKKTTIGILANAANSKLHYDQYFSMLPTGPEPQKAFSRGFFELAAGAKPRPKTVAIVAADAEFAQNAADGARQTIERSAGSKSSPTGTIRRRRPTSRRSCAR